MAVPGVWVHREFRGGRADGKRLALLLLCRLGLHSPCKTEYIEVTRRRSDRHGGKYHTNYIVCRRCGKLCYRMRRRREKTI